MEHLELETAVQELKDVILQMVGELQAEVVEAVFGAEAEAVGEAAMLRVEAEVEVVLQLVLQMAVVM